MSTKKIMASAKHEDCTVRLPEICNYDPTTTVFAHINGVRFGKGVGIKTKLGSYCCSACHQAIDEGQRPRWMTKEQVLIAHYEGTLETIVRLIEKGLVILK